MIAGPDPHLMTIEQFLEQRPDMPECGQWTELHAGRPVHLQPPDVDHGNVILNLSKELASYFQSQRRGYACFDLGLWLSESPDTVLFPAISIYVEGPRSAESDLSVTRAIPALVVELASTSDRRQLQTHRLSQYLRWGVSSVWQIDPQDETLTIISAKHPQRSLANTSQAEELPELPGFSFAVKDLFAIPDWFK